MNVKHLPELISYEVVSELQKELTQCSQDFEINFAKVKKADSSILALMVEIIFHFSDKKLQLKFTEIPKFISSLIAAYRMEPIISPYLA